MLSRLLHRSEEPKPLVSLSPGEFWIVRDSSSPKGLRELIFKQAELTLNATTRKDIVTIGIKDLNNEKEDENEEQSVDSLLDDDNKEYLVHPVLQLGYNSVNGHIVIIWKDLETDGDKFEFVCSSDVTGKSLDAFDETAAKSLYMQTHDKLPPSSQWAEAFSNLFTSYSADGEPDASNPDPSAATNATNATNPVKKEEDAVKKEEKPVLNGYMKVDGEEIYAANCSLCIFDPEKQAFASPQNLTSVLARLVRTAPLEYVIEVVKDNVAILGVEVSPELDLALDIPTNGITFNEFTPERMTTYLTMFEDKQSMHDFEEQVSIAMYEVANKKKWTTLKDVDQEYVLNAMQEMTMTDCVRSDSDNDSDDNDDSDNDSGNEEDKYEYDDGKYIDDSQEGKQFNESGELNSALETGHVNDRSYVVRGKRIGVFSNSNEGLKFSTTIENIDFDLKNIMLHESDRALMIQNKDDPNSLYRMDLETGKIVDEWNTHKGINAINPVSKFAQTTDESTLLGVARNSMFRLDPRLSAGIVDTGNEKIYSQNLGFTKIATTVDGFFAVGDQKGNIRLYDQLGKNAKMQIVGLGDPILGLDVTADGSYVLATCERYLLLIEARTAGINGFHQLWPKDSRPRPKKLTVSAMNANYMYQQTKKQISFTPARFNAGPNTKEVSIITSTGPYLISWSLKKVLNNDSNQYTIKQYGSQITAENFEFGSDKRVIVTLTNNVEIVSNDALKNPNLVLSSNKKRK